MQYDACGVCGGDDKTGATCINKIRIFTGYADVSLRPVYDLSSNTQMIVTTKVSNISYLMIWRSVLPPYSFTY